ncbi:unnamed protein product [Schistosoma curassoni]|uniref:Uncharacterized protein n=1 Tax=Schistosoma curassoni TaxID=6186 RepID=A0A183L0I1_9TREM|nr:unnamed protein product [Schistosoma curassoni]
MISRRIQKIIQLIYLGHWNTSYNAITRYVCGKKRDLMNEKNVTLLHGITGFPVSLT